MVQRKLPALCAAAAALLAVVAAPLAAHATAKIRVEWVRTAAVPVEPSLVFGAQTLTVTGAVSQVQTNAAPSFGIANASSSYGVAHVTVISGAAIAAWGSSPTATEATGLRLQQGEERWIPISTGQTFAFVEAADGPLTEPVSRPNTSWSTTTLSVTANTWILAAAANAVRQKLILADAGVPGCVWTTNSAPAAGEGIPFSVTADGGSWTFEDPVPSNAIYVKCAASGVVTVGEA